MPGEAYSDNDEAFRRTFERDKDELRALGLPLVVETVPGTDPPIDGYRIHQSDYEDGIPELDSDELAALHLASNLVRMEGAPADDPFFKLGGVVHDGEGPLARVPGGGNVQDLMRAAIECRVMSFGYGVENRLVEPHRLVFSRGHWYLAGYDKDREATRVFRVDRISSSVVVGDERFEISELVPEVGDELPWCYGEEEPVCARLLVDARHAPWVVEHLGTTAVVEHRDDGSVIVETQVRKPEVFRSFALMFLEGAEILEPPELRQDMRSWLESLT
jgi:predicted DNA-binding transcriptional regulator YafY